VSAAFLMQLFRQVVYVWRIGRLMYVSAGTGLSLVLLCKYEAVVLLPYVVSVFLCVFLSGGCHDRLGCVSLKSRERVCSAVRPLACVIATLQLACQHVFACRGLSQCRCLRLVPLPVCCLLQMMVLTPDFFLYHRHLLLCLSQIAAALTVGMIATTGACVSASALAKCTDQELNAATSEASFVGSWSGTQTDMFACHTAAHESCFCCSCCAQAAKTPSCTTAPPCKSVLHTCAQLALLLSLPCPARVRPCLLLAAEVYRNEWSALLQRPGPTLLARPSMMLLWYYLLVPILQQQTMPEQALSCVAQLAHSLLIYVYILKGSTSLVLVVPLLLAASGVSFTVSFLADAWTRRQAVAGVRRSLTGPATG
jgi:hypothetical protein